LLLASSSSSSCSCCDVGVADVDDEVAKYLIDNDRDDSCWCLGCEQEGITGDGDNYDDECINELASFDKDRLRSYIMRLVRKAEDTSSTTITTNKWYGIITVSRE